MVVIYLQYKMFLLNQSLKEDLGKFGINLQYKMFLLNLTISNRIPFFSVFVDTNIFIYFYQKFLFIFLYNSQKTQ